MVGACLAPSIGHADTKVISKSGNWEAFGGTSTAGKPVCGISYDTKEQYFGVKLFAGDASFTVQMSKKNWKIADKAKQDLTVTYGTYSPWKATGVGMHFGDGDAGIEFTVKQSENAEFFKEFGSADKLHVQFPGTSVAEWTLSLDGVDEVRASYLKCVSNLN